MAFLAGRALISVSAAFLATSAVPGRVLTQGDSLRPTADSTQVKETSYVRLPHLWTPITVGDLSTTKSPGRNILGVLQTERMRNCGTTALWGALIGVAAGVVIAEVAPLNNRAYEYWAIVLGGGLVGFFVGGSPLFCTAGST
jgi:hypothetical protein